jgi:hypothetical protein
MHAVAAFVPQCCMCLYQAAQCVLLPAAQGRHSTPASAGDNKCQHAVKCCQARGRVFVAACLELLLELYEEQIMRQMTAAVSQPTAGVTAQPTSCRCCALHVLGLFGCDHWSALIRLWRVQLAVRCFVCLCMSGWQLHPVCSAALQCCGILQ